MMFDLDAIDEMMHTYDERQVARYEYADGSFIVDTSKVLDRHELSYETAISHIDYCPGEWCIVEMYATEEESKIGHLKWVDKMWREIPDTLIDVWAAYHGEHRVWPRIEHVPTIPIIIPRSDTYTREGYIVLEDNTTIMLTEEEDCYFTDRSLIQDLMMFFIRNYQFDGDFVYPIQLGKVRITIEVLKD